MFAVVMVITELISDRIWENRPVSEKFNFYVHK